MAIDYTTILSNLDAAITSMSAAIAEFAAGKPYVTQHMTVLGEQTSFRTFDDLVSGLEKTKALREKFATEETTTGTPYRAITVARRGPV